MPSKVEEEFSSIFRDIEQDGLAGNAVDDRMTSKGLFLYDNVFPIDLKRLYWKIRDRIQSIQVLSDEPWIPWEIVKPVKDSDNDEIKSIEEEFLCQRYSFSRWILGKIPFKRKERIEKVMLIGTGTPGYSQEGNWIQQFGNRIGLKVDSASTYAEVISIMQKRRF